jgi:hypothetical protein
MDDTERGCKGAGPWYCTSGFHKILGISGAALSVSRKTMLHKISQSATILYTEKGKDHIMVEEWIVIVSMY